jgi:penicillin amidase
VADFAAMQVDVVSTFAQALLPTLRAVPRKDDLAGHAAALLDGWDGAMTMDAPQPLIFNAWMQRFDLDLMTHAGMPPTAARPWAEFITWVLSPGALSPGALSPGGVSPGVVSPGGPSPGTPNPAAADWCNGPCTAALDVALHEAVQDLAKQFGQNPAAWRWGAAHIATFADPVLPLLSVRIPQPGDDTTIFRGGMRLGTFDAVHGPGYRGVYDLANLDRSLFMTAPGQSGHPFSRHAHDLLRRWRDGAGVMLTRDPPQIEATLRLVP